MILWAAIGLLLFFVVRWTAVLLFSLSPSRRLVAFAVAMLFLFAGSFALLLAYFRQASFPPIGWGIIGGATVLWLLWSYFAHRRKKSDLPPRVHLALFLSLLVLLTGDTVAYRFFPREDRRLVGSLSIGNAPSALSLVQWWGSGGERLEERVSGDLIGVRISTARFPVWLEEMGFPLLWKVEWLENSYLTAEKMKSSPHEAFPVEGSVQPPFIGRQWIWKYGIIFSLNHQLQTLYFPLSSVHEAKIWASPSGLTSEVR